MYRPVKEREALVMALVDWRETAWGQHPHRAVVTRRWILPNQTITTLSKVCAKELLGPRTVSEIADRTEEWEITYALGIYNVISLFDEQMRLRKLRTDLGYGVAKKARGVAWQKQTKKRFVQRAEQALTIAGDTLENISRFEEVAAAEERRLLARHRTTANDMAQLRRNTNARRSRLRRRLEDAVRNVEVHSEFLREAVAWSDGLVETGDDDDNGGMDEE